VKEQAVRALAMSSLAVVLAVASARAGSSTRIEVDVPFDFTIANQALPAGAYTVTQEATGVLRIRSLDHRASAAALGEVIRGRGRNGDAVLVFERYGERCFLAEAWLGLGGGFQMSKSGRELELAKGRSKGLATKPRQPEVIVIAAR